MLKRMIVKRLVIGSLSLTLLLLFYFFPVNNDIEETIEYRELGNNEVVYLLDNEDYVSYVNLYLESNDVIELIKNKINILINGSNEFYNTIPVSTKLTNVILDKNSVTLDFSKELLSIDPYYERKMIESIIYSITEINGINEIYIKVDGIMLDYLPYSKEALEYPLTKEFGINKEYDIVKLSDITKTTVYFLKEQNDIKYYVPITKMTNNETDKIDIIINEMKSSVNYQSNLISYLSNNVKVDNYEIVKDTFMLELNDFFFDTVSSNIIEEVKYAITLSIKANYEVKDVNFKLKN